MKKKNQKINCQYLDIRDPPVKFLKDKISKSQVPKKCNDSR